MWVCVGSPSGTGLGDFLKFWPNCPNFLEAFLCHYERYHLLSKKQARLLYGQLLEKFVQLLIPTSGHTGFGRTYMRLFKQNINQTKRYCVELFRGSNFLYPTLSTKERHQISSFQVVRWRWKCPNTNCPNRKCLNKKYPNVQIKIVLLLNVWILNVLMQIVQIPKCMNNKMSKYKLSVYKISNYKLSNYEMPKCKVS